MREIKFRAWHKVTELMDEVVTIDLYDEEIGVLYANHITQGEDIQRFDFDEIELMQSTGLKDKNGVEIYEGDIVKVSDDVDSYVTEVYWGGEEYPAFDLNYKYIPTMWFYDCNVLSAIVNSATEKIEVVGNIYENRKLLDEQ